LYSLYRVIVELIAGSCI